MAARQEIAKQVVLQKLVASEEAHLLRPSRPTERAFEASATDDQTAKRLAYE